MHPVMYWTQLTEPTKAPDGKHRNIVARCVCGIEKQLDYDNFRRGLSKSCGCMRGRTAREGIAVAKGSKWTPVGKVRRHDKHYYVECRCECGTRQEVRLDNLKDGESLSCGCAERTPTTYHNQGEAGLSALYQRIRSSAMNRGHEFDLSMELVKELTSCCCFYCGEKPSQASTVHSKTNSAARKDFARYLYNGLDRFNNDIGYVEGNVVPCCRACNVAKNHYSFEEFIGRAQRIAARFPMRKEA